MKKTNIIGLIIFVATVALLCGCKCKIDINDVDDQIAEVIDGATIRLNSGLTVHINGLKPSNSFCKEQLGRYIGEEVTLMTDSEVPDTKVSSYEDECDAYVRVVRTGEDLGYEILKQSGRDGYYALNCHDRQDVYEALFQGSAEALSSAELCARMTAASMLVYAGDDEANWIGTAFFIGNDGLALTNNHVLNHQTDGRVYLSDSQGNMDLEQPFRIKRIVYTDPTYDYTIFYVDLDPTTLKRIVYLPLAKDAQTFSRGTKIGAIGNPAPGQSILTMSFTTGVIAAIRDDEGKIQHHASITHGFSGGPTANFYGEAIGISQSGYDNTNASLNFSVDIRIVRNQLDKLNLPYAGK